MTRDAVAAIVIDRVLLREGGIGHVGGEPWVTRFGQTPEWLDTFNLPAPDTQAEAAKNYRHWLEITRLIEVCDVLDALSDGVIDFAVHAGHGRAIRAMQAALGTRPDGVIGPDTVARLRWPHGVVGPATIAQVSRWRSIAASRILADRNEFCYGLFGSNPNKYARFAKGWGRRISEQIRGLVAEETT